MQKWLDDTVKAITDRELAERMTELSDWIEKRVCGDTFQARLAYAMRRKGYNQTDLGDRAGVAPNTVSQWLSGMNRPAYDCLIAAALALDVSIDWLVFGKGKR